MGRVVLISTYELGRQPFGLASPAAWLTAAGASVVQQDLAVSPFDAESVREADLVAIYVPMHTATRMAEPIVARVRALTRRSHVCVYGLYAPMNFEHLRLLGADSIIGGEFEQPLVELYQDLVAGKPLRLSTSAPLISLGRQEFLVPDRTGLPSLTQYARLRTGSGSDRVVGYTEATRGCKHRCRHCPIVPVYDGRFRVVQIEPVLEDIRQQVAAGAQHITFGDPDFFNAPTHSMRIVKRLHDEFPDLSYDATIKVEHLAKHVDLLGELRRTGCVLVTTAVESFDDNILTKLDKTHTAADLDMVLAQLRGAGLALNPTFVAFTPWTTRIGYAEFLQAIFDRELVDLVAPVQYCIRLLIPAGSRILELDDVRKHIGNFDPALLAYPWLALDPRVDQLQHQVEDVVKSGQRAGRGRREIFASVWQVARHFLERGTSTTGPNLHLLPPPAKVPQLSESWYCCAEPTDEQLARL